MDGPVFDAMLKTALEEALRRDIEETAAPPPPSRRQRRRMRGLLADFRRGRSEAPTPESRPLSGGGGHCRPADRRGGGGPGPGRRGAIPADV